MNGLILHCGAEQKSRDEIFAVPAPPPTSTYVPLHFATFVSRIEKQLAVEGIEIEEEQFALSKNTQRMFGLLALKMPNVTSADFRCVLGLRNSYDKSMSSGVCVGASVLVCDNLSFSGEVTFARKHTANLLRDLSWLITETVALLPARFLTQSQTFDRYRNTPLTDSKAHDLIIQLVDAEAINFGDVRNVLKEWREPKHPAFESAGKSAWRLFNAATEVIKGDLWRLPFRTSRLHKLLNAEFGFPNLKETLHN